MLTVQATDCGVTYDRLYNCNMFIVPAIGKLAKDKHFSLFCDITRDEEKSFITLIAEIRRLSVELKPVKMKPTFLLILILTLTTLAESQLLNSKKKKKYGYKGKSDQIHFEHTMSYVGIVPKLQMAH